MRLRDHRGTGAAAGRAADNPRRRPETRHAADHRPLRQGSVTVTTASSCNTAATGLLIAQAADSTLRPLNADTPVSRDAVRQLTGGHEIRSVATVRKS